MDGFLAFTNFHSTREKINFDFIKRDTEEFIKKAKLNSVEEGKYNVYAIKFTLDKKGFCLTYGYFSSPLDADQLLKFRYYFYVGKELVLVDIPDKMSQKYILINNPLRQLKNKSRVRNKLSKEPFLGSHFGVVNCYSSNDTIKTFYENDESIPLDKAILIYKDFDEFPVKIDSSDMRKHFSETKDN